METDTGGSTLTFSESAWALTHWRPRPAAPPPPLPAAQLQDSGGRELEVAVGTEVCVSKHLGRDGRHRWNSRTRL